MHRRHVAALYFDGIVRVNATEPVTTTPPKPPPRPHVTGIDVTFRLSRVPGVTRSTTMRLSYGTRSD